MSALLLKPSGSTGEVVSVTQERAGWQTISLRLIRIEKSRKQVVSQPSEELALVMLAGQATVRAGEQQWEYLGGRANVFAGMPHTLYLPLGTERVEIEALTNVLRGGGLRSPGEPEVSGGCDRAFIGRSGNPRRRKCNPADQPHPQAGFRR